MKQFAGFYFDFRGRRTGDNYFQNQHGVVSVGRMFVVDDVLSKLKSFSFNKGKVIEVIVRMGSSLHFHREKDLFLSSRILIVFTSVSI